MRDLDTEEKEALRTAVKEAQTAITELKNSNMELKTANAELKKQKLTLGKAIKLVLYGIGIGAVLTVIFGHEEEE